MSEEELVQATGEAGASDGAVTQPEEGVIPQAALDSVRRRLARRIAAMIVREMADNDVSFATLAARLGRDEQELRAYLYRLIDGNGDDGLNMISDVFLAMGSELEFSIARPQPPQPMGDRTVIPT